MTNKKKKEIDYKDTFYLIKRLVIDYVKPHWLSFCGAITLMIMISLLTGAHAYLVKPALDQVFLERNKKMLTILPIVIFAISALKAFSVYWQKVAMSIISDKIYIKMQKDLYKKLINSDMELFDQTSSGLLVAGMTSDVGIVMAAVNGVLIGMIRECLTLMALVGVMFKQSWELSFVALVGFPLAVIPIYKIGKKMRNLSTVNQEKVGEFYARMNDSLQYAKLVKSYRAEDLEVEKMHFILDIIFKLKVRLTKLIFVASPFVEALGGFGVAGVIWYGGMKVLNGYTTPGAFFSFFTALAMAYKPLKAVGSMNTTFQLGLAGATRFFIRIDRQPKILEKPKALTLKKVKGDIEFKDVHFSYFNGAQALKGVNLKIKAGKTAALVGHSGSGKSTIMNLLLRLYDINSGKISLDGHNIKNLSFDTVRGQMSVVTQETMLFDTSVRNNILYNSKDKTHEDIVEAAKLAEAHEFIEALPNGYDTPIGQNGIKLSGGQRQRISIARAILCNAPVLLLDEATSSLDPISEKLVKNAIDRLMEDRTTLVIAHRLSTVINADKIFVIDRGKVVEEGTHQELLAMGGKYANLYSKQFLEESRKK